MKNFAVTLGLLAALCVPSVEAANQEVRALFQPDPAQPNKNEFINKTPNSGYCAINPSECADNRMFSIRVPIGFQSFRAIRPGEGVAVNVPANWRQLTVTNQDTQETETVEIRITGLGSRYVLSDSAANLVGVTDMLEGHQKLWGGSSWVNAPSPCQYSGIGGYSAAAYEFFWKTPLEAACTKLAEYTIPSMSLQYLDIAYELRTPNPLGMSSGLYNGSMSYFVGPAGDFSMGPMMTPNDWMLTLDFVLDVQHTLKVDLPPGGNKVVLEPEGGWRSWIESGRKPTRIYRDQPFYLSASSRFKVMLQCDSLGGDICYLRGRGTSIGVKTLMTLPTGIHFGDTPGPGDGQVKLFTLAHNSWRGPFQPGRYVDRKAGSLRFEISARDIDSLLRPGFSDTLSGNITVIWDSEV
ncbi:hypothetical protein ACYZTX_24920 [Pseudomonas sp. MDT1-17]